MPRPALRRFLLLLSMAIGLAPAAWAGEPARSKKAHPKAAAPKAAQAKAARSRAKTPEPPAYGRRDDVMAFAADVAARRGLDEAWARGALERARYSREVARYILPPPAGTAKNWAAYRGRFVEPIRIGAGVAFWRANRAWLARAEEAYGVPPEIVAGIVGVETIYGRQMGNFRVIDALATLAFDFPPGRKDRSEFFRAELESFLVMCERERLDPLVPKGSYAGAMGMPQFMPSSVLKYAVDFDGDAHIDLANEPADVIGSVAHYLAEFGWQRGLPTRFDVRVPVETTDRALLLAPDILPTFTADEFAQHGARLDDAALAGPPIKLALVELQNGAAAPSYVAGTTNFYAITRYNWSSYYAMAVIELGEAIAGAVAQEGGAARTPALARRRPRE
jgi:membrane-bound lytic murein transglycosylase B